MTTLNQKKEELSLDTPALPKGGGAITNKQDAQVTTFTGALSYPIPFTLPAARNGSQAKLEISYDSSNGNGVFGLGFSLSNSKISVRTDWGFPKYDGSEQYLLDGMELVFQGQIIDPLGTLIKTYLPRINNSYELIQQWINPSDQTSYWKIVDAANNTFLYGTDSLSRIANPKNDRQIYAWLLLETTDPLGNKIKYSYQSENQQNIPDHTYERNRDHQANRYLQKIQYGNYLPAGELTEKYAFEVCFDYGEYDLSNSTEPSQNWACRPDPFSRYDSGFEIRTYRLCQRILLFHCFSELGESPCLVKSLSFTYSSQQNYQGISLTTMSMLRKAQTTGYQKQPDGSYRQRSKPAIEFTFSTFSPPKTPDFHPLEVDHSSLPNFLEGAQFLPVDLNREGIPGILFSSSEMAMYYSPLGRGRYAPPEILSAFPLPRDLQQSGATFKDLEGNGELQLEWQNRGFFEKKEEGWSGLQSFENTTNSFLLSDIENADLTANGKSDALFITHDNVHLYPSQGKKGYAESLCIPQDNKVPVKVMDDPQQVVSFGSIFGDGLQHRFRFSNGAFECWPNLGYGRFGEKIELSNAPYFPEGLDTRRVQFSDIDGSGTMDIIYISDQQFHLFLNQNGNSFSDPITCNLPDSYSSLDQITSADIYGDGTQCLVFTKISPTPIHYCYHFTGEYHSDSAQENTQSFKPYLLQQILNNAGTKISFQYNSSTSFYLADKAVGRIWPTKLHFPVQVLERLCTEDLITGDQIINRYAYHDGYYDSDPRERKFNGFGFVETWDTETLETQNDPAEIGAFVPPIYTKTWMQPGLFAGYDQLLQFYQSEFYQGDEAAYDFPKSLLSPDIYRADAQTFRQAFVALKGRTIRSEVYGLDGSAAEENPYTVEASNELVILEQAASAGDYAVFSISPRESISYQYDRDPVDPRIQQQFTLESN